MSSEKDLISSLVGNVTGLVYQVAGDTLFGPPVGELVGGVADHVAGDITGDTLEAINNVIGGDVSALPELVNVVTDPMAVANEHLLEEVPIVGHALSDGLNILKDIPGIGDVLGGIF